MTGKVCLVFWVRSLGITCDISVCGVEIQEDHSLPHPCDFCSKSCCDLKEPDRQIGFSSMGDARVGSEGFGRRVRAALLWCKVVA